MNTCFRWVAELALVGAVLVASGCASLGGEPETIQRETKPSQGTDYVMLDVRRARHVRPTSVAAVTEPEPLFVYPLKLGTFNSSATEKNNEGIALHAKGDVRGAQQAYLSARADLIANAHPNDLVALRMVPLDRSLPEPGKWAFVGVAAYELGGALARVDSNIGIAKWAQGDLQGALSHFQAALEMRARYEGAIEYYASDRALMARNNARLLESSVLLSLEGSLPESAGSHSLALEMVFQRKGELLDRQTQSIAQVQRQALPQGPAPKPGALDVTDKLLPALDLAIAVAGYLGPAGATAATVGSVAHKLLSIGAGTREQRRAAERDLRERDRKIGVESQEMLDERNAIMRQRAALTNDSDQNSRLDERQEALDLQIRVRANPPDTLRVGTSRPTSPEVAQGPASNVRPLSDWVRSIGQRIPDGAVLLEMFMYVPMDPRAPMAPGGRQIPPRPLDAITAASEDAPVTPVQMDALPSGPAHYGMYVISRNGPPVRIELGEAQPIDERIVEFRTVLARPKKANDVRAKARQLDELLMRPVRSVIGDTALLLVAPEGLLNLVPFGALVDEQNRYLVERYTFSYLSSGRDLLRPGSNVPRRDNDLIVADPAFGGKSVQVAATAQEGGRGTRSRDFSSMQFEALPGTALEAAAIKGLFPDAKVLTGPAATETAFKQIHGPRVLHVATHGFFLPDQEVKRVSKDGREDPMLRSGLVFANVNTGGTESDDGVLTALEASGIDLLGTRLVVLSACETGVGTVKNGEGVFGMRRAFVVAGAETLLMTLWPIADEATQELMSDYYEALKQGSGRADALRKAQLQMLGKKETGHPFFWAGFISSGDWTSLAINPPHSINQFGDSNGSGSLVSWSVDVSS
ncbi:CHAT domain-containing protein [Variovorax sp. J22R133]|uniref:CHAT domain-containing protein n=1 Tax=Variovorax brevis TaxID=3053503 RepID=UPI002575BC60|nr:CHAT domain-containing protein [Variovorax sp. J22R133]MDM0118021.1 CHAT domain-containing protein [Variovorax sp. J22R133]